MIKQTLCFSNPTYLSVRNSQLVIKFPEVEKAPVPDFIKREGVITRPIEDIGVVILDNKQITITSSVISELLKNNCALISCDDHHMPTGLMLNLDGCTIQSERFRDQIDASLPLKKQIWQLTIQQKIFNQACVLKKLRNAEVGNMQAWVKEVRSGDADNLEARAAAYYWRNMFPNVSDFSRDREGVPPNNFLNYGYAILRAVVARSLVGSGLLPTLGVHHHNKYNAYCLADDIMEPYRPYVDELVVELMENNGYPDDVAPYKAQLLQIPTLDVMINGKRRPLMVATQITTASLYQSYKSGVRQVLYPEMPLSA